MGGETEIPSAGSSFLERVTGVFASPVLTFENVRHRPRFFSPFLATLTLFAGFWGVVYLRVGLSGMAIAMVQYFRRGTLVTQREIDFALQFSSALPRWVLIGGAISIVVHLLIVALIGIRFADMILGARVRLRRALSVACYADLARMIVQTALAIPLLLFGGIRGLNFGNFIPTNIAFFLDPGNVSRTLYVLLQSLDPVQLWYFMLVGIGLSNDPEDLASPVMIAGGFTALWLAWNVLFAALSDFLLRS
ncbi:MAG: YIP1 family protein [Terriglobia bacterium]